MKPLTLVPLPPPPPAAPFRSDSLAAGSLLKLVMYCVRGCAGDGDRERDDPRRLHSAGLHLTTFLSWHLLACQSRKARRHCLTLQGIRQRQHHKVVKDKQLRTPHQGASRKRASSSYEGLPRRADL